MKQFIKYQTEEDAKLLAEQIKLEGKKILGYYSNEVVTGWTEPKVHVDTNGYTIIDEMPKAIKGFEQYMIVAEENYEEPPTFDELVAMVKAHDIAIKLIQEKIK